MSKNKDKNIIKTLILGGGGAKGYAYIGAIKALREYGVLNTVNTICGTSIGAFFSILLCLDFSDEELSKYGKTDFSNFHDIKLDNLLEEYGLDSAKKFIDYVELLISDKVDKNITLLELYKLSGKTLIITSVCIEDACTKWFSYKNEPDMKVITAFRLSIAIPFIFTVGKYKGKHYLDGLILEGLPLSKFNKNDDSILVLNLKSNIYDCCPKIESFESFATGLFWCLRNNLKTDRKYYNVIGIPSQNMNPLDFNAPIETRMKLESIGYSSVINYMNNYLKKNL